MVERDARTMGRPRSHYIPISLLPDGDVCGEMRAANRAIVTGVIVFTSGQFRRTDFLSLGTCHFAFRQRGVRGVIQAATYLRILSERLSLGLRSIVLFGSAFCARAVAAVAKSARLAFKLHFGICCHFISLVPFR